MLLLSSLSPRELKDRLVQPGLILRTGPFTTLVRTSISSVAEGIARLYADYPLVPHWDFADFHISLDRPANYRRWYKPQVLFRFDGQTPFKPLPLAQAFPMLEWGLNWCISNHANRYLIVHAAVVEKNGFAAVLPAPPGSGKSTLCAALVYNGWRLLSDELTLIRLDDGDIVPVPRPVSLKNSSIDIIGKYVENSVFSPRVSDTLKGEVAHLKPPADSVARAGAFVPPAWIIFPKYEAGAALRLEEMPRPQAVLNLAENAFNFSSLGRHGFETLIRTVNTSQSYRLVYSSLDDAINAFAALEPEVLAA